MVYHKISPDMKQRALQLIDQRWEMQDVADILGVASKSIRRWADNYDTYGRVDPPSVLRGCPRLLNSEAISDLQELIRETPTLFLDEIGEWLALYHDQPISTTALHDNLDLPIRYCGKLLRNVMILHGQSGSHVLSPTTRLVKWWFSMNLARMARPSFESMGMLSLVKILPFSDRGI